MSDPNFIPGDDPLHVVQTGHPDSLTPEVQPEGLPPAGLAALQSTLQAGVDAAPDMPPMRDEVQQPVSFADIAPNPANAPVEARLPLMNYTVYLLAADFEHAKNFAFACLNSMQPWTYIEGPETLQGLWTPTVLVFSDYAQRADAQEVMLMARSRNANLTANPQDLVNFGPPLPLPSQGDPDVSGSLPGPIARAVGAQAQLGTLSEAALRDGASPMDIPPRA